MLWFALERPALGTTSDAPAATADRHAVQSDVQAISENVMSPFCPGRTLAACPSEQARKLREQVASWITEGYSHDAIYGLLETTYGQEIRGTPRKGGFGIVGWTMPFIFFVVLTAAVLVFIRRLMRRPGAAALPVHQPDDESLRRIEAELSERMRR